VAGIFVDSSGKGLLIEVYHNDIVMDGCSPIPAVGQCLNGVTNAAGLVRGPKSTGINGLLYLLPVLVSTGAVITRRRRRSKGDARRRAEESSGQV
jgi:hypothetical protein